MLKLHSKSIYRLGLFVALVIFSQSAIAQEKEPTPLPPLPDPELSTKPAPKKDSHSESTSSSSSSESSSRYQDRYPKFSTVQTAFTNWSKQDNEGVIGQISSDKWEKMAKWMTKVIDYRGVLDTDACSSKDASSAELRSALNFCFGAADGETPAAVYRLVLALKEETLDAEEVRGALREIDLCKSALKKMADGKRRKLGDRANRSPMDWELDLDNIQPLLGALAQLKVDAVASPSPSPWAKSSGRTRAEECIIYHRDCYQQRLDETPLDKMCLLGEKPVEQVSARPTPPKQDDASPPPVTPQPAPVQQTPGQPAPMQPVPQPQAVPPVAAPSYPATPNYPATPPVAGGVGGGYRKGGGGGCGGCGGGGVGGGIVAAPVARGPVGVSVGVGVGPRFPAPVPLPYPPIGFPVGGPVIMGGGELVGGGPGPSVGSVAVVSSRTTIVSNAPMGNSMMMFPPRTCQKCPPGMRGPQVNPLMRPGYPMPYRPGFLQVQRPPMVTPYGQPGVMPYPQQPGVTPYYPGQQPGMTPNMPPTTGGTYGPITIGSTYPSTQPISPYMNPTFFGQPQTQYGPITPDRGGVGRVALKNS